MKDVTTSNFGLLIAYLLPGFTVVWGISYLVPPVRVWLGAVPATSPTVGGFLYITLASVGSGMIVSTIRWAIIDTIHYWTGIRPSPWDFTQLQNNVAAYDLLRNIHYAYYQFYGNGAVALSIWYAACWISLQRLWPPPWGWGILGVIGLELLFFAGSRDTFRKYHRGVGIMLGGRPEKTAP
jgi:hypothetical protein